METLGEMARYWNLIIFYAPLGVIGVWRWSIWLAKKVISFFYRSPKGNFYSTLSIVTPVYNEDPEMFSIALESWKANEPDEIIAVIDHSNPALIDIFKDFSAGFFGARLIVTQTPGKRPALADGIREANGEIVALVDSDTIWSFDIKRKLLGPFSDPNVGGLLTRQDVLYADTLSRRIFKVLLDERYLFEYPFLSVISDAMLCVSGRTAVYRRSAISDKLDDLVDETFWGQKMISGDDKTLTNLVHAAGWKTLFLRDVKVYTPGTPEIGSFLKQKLRWARNGLRSDSKILMSGWIWKRHKLLALYMLDKFVSPIALLLGPVYFFVSIYLGYWQVAAILFCWWMISRAIKIFPHLREEPRDIKILPAYVLMTFFMAVVKIYAFFTLDKQGWITRWDADRLNRLNPLRQGFAFLMTAVFIGGYFFAIGSYEYKTLSQKSSSQNNGMVASYISDGPNSISTAELSAKRNSAYKNVSANAYGVYMLKAGDTLYGLQKKFNIVSIDRIMYENRIPIANPAYIPVGSKITIPILDLRKTLDVDVLYDNRIIRRVPLVFFDRKTNTIYVKGSGSVVTLSKIRQALADKSLLENKSGEWILRSNLYIGKNVTLAIDGREVSRLKLKSDGSGHVWMRSQNGNILISDTKITSWDESKNSPDLEYKDGRSYIVAKGSGRMDVINSDIGYLGYAGLPKRGGPFGGSYGLSWKNNSGKFKDNLLLGSVTNSKMHDNYFGIYTFGATGMIIQDNKVFNNIEYGIDPHDDSNNLLIARNETFSNGNHGIILSKRCFNNEVSNNISHDNKLHGIMLDRNSNNNIVKNNTAFHNVDGIAIYDSHNNLIDGNNIYANKQGIRLNQNSSANYIANNEINSNRNGMHIYGRSNNNFAIGNNIEKNEVGLSMQDAWDNILYGNLKTFGNSKDAHITVGKDANEIK